MIVAAGLVLVFALPLTAQEARLPADSMEIGRQYTKWFLAYEADSLWAHMTPEMQERHGSTDRLVEMMDQVALQVGTEVEVLEERYVTRNGKPQFWHTGLFSQLAEPIQIRWVIEPDGKISGAGINPASQAPPVDPE
jgi:hypothetical protein